MPNILGKVKNKKKGITPVIATIILIAGTLILALVVGAYTFGLFGSNVKNIQLTSALLNSGAGTTNATPGANFQLTFNNPGGPTNMTSIQLSQGGQTVPETYFTCSSTTCSAVTNFGNAFPIRSGAGVSLIVYFGNALSSGTTYSYVISFANGQSIPGSLIAQ